jgi:hypothetical protein
VSAPIGVERISAVAPIVSTVARRSFSTHRLNGWAHAHPVAWSVAIGAVFAGASFAASVAFGSRSVTALVVDLAGGAIFGLLVWITARYRLRS